MLLLLCVTTSLVLVLQPAAGQSGITIDSSSDIFFGPSLVWFLITDPSLGGDGSDTINVTIEARRGLTVLGSTTATITEIGDSGAFELFVTTSNAGVEPADPFAATPVDASIVRINTGPIGNANDASIDLSDDEFPTAADQLQDGDTIRILYGPISRTISFQDTSANLITDRTTAGDNNEIVLFLNDIDANTDPTTRDTFTLATVVTSTNAVTYPSGAMWTETGENTGTFELTVVVNGAAPDNFLTATLPTSNIFTVIDHNVYEAIGGAIAPYNAVTPTSATSSAAVTLRNEDGAITLQADATLANELRIQVTDPDRNIRTAEEDELAFGIVTVEIDSFAEVLDEVTFTETGDNTGIFVADLDDDRIQISAGFSDIVGPESITLQPETISEDRDMVITYYDEAAANNLPETFNLFTTILHTKGILDGPFATSAGDEMSLTLVDPDLNSDSDIIETYVIIFPPSATTQPVAFANGTAMFDLKVRGESFTVGTTPFTITFVETGPNTGIFEGDVETGILIDLTGANYGDQIKFKYLDIMESTNQEDSAIVFVGNRILSDPEMTAPDIVLAGEAIDLIVGDRDADFDSEYPDWISVLITSDSNPTGINLQASETTHNSGVFTVTIPTSTGSLSGAITVTPGDSVSLIYSDINPGSGTGATRDFVRTIGIDALPPVPIISLPLDGSMLNMSNPVIAGTAPAGATVRVFAEGRPTPIATTAAHDDGFWSVESVTLSDADYSIFAIAYDFGLFSDVERESPPSDTVTFTIDMTPSLAPVVTSPEEDVFTKDNTPSIRGDPGGNSRVSILIDGEEVAQRAVGGTEFFYTLTLPLADGLHEVYVVGIDSAGNRSEPSAPVTFIVDTIGPTVSIRNPEEGQTIDSENFTVSGTASDASGISRVEVSIDEGPYMEATTTTSWSLPVTVSEGPHNIAVRAFDLAGNSGDGTRGVTVSLTPDILTKPGNEFETAIIATGIVGGVATTISVLNFAGKINVVKSIRELFNKIKPPPIKVKLYAGIEDLLSNSQYENTEELNESFGNSMSESKDEFREKLSMLKDAGQLTAKIHKAGKDPDAIITETSNELLGKLLERARPITSLFLDEIQAEIEFKGYGSSDKQVRINVRVAPRHIKPYAGVKVLAAGAEIFDARATFRIETYIEIKELEITHVKKDDNSSLKLDLKNVEFTLRIFLETISYCGRQYLKNKELQERKFNLKKLSPAKHSTEDVLPTGRSAIVYVLPKKQRKCRACGHAAAPHHNNCGNCGEKLDAS